MVKDVDVEVISGDDQKKSRRSFEDRVMRGLSAINGNLNRIADATEKIAESLGEGAEIDPIANATASLARLFGSGGLGGGEPKRKRRKG